MMTLIMVLGKSGSGKDYLVNSVLDYPLVTGKWELLTKYTTRPAREEELKHKNPQVKFITDEQYNEGIKRNKFIVTSSFETEQGTWKYALAFPKTDHAICIGDLQFYDILSTSLEEEETIKLIPVYIDTDDQQRLMHSIERTPDDLERVCSRFIRDQHDFSDDNEVFRKLMDNAIGVRNKYGEKDHVRLVDICRLAFDEKDVRSLYHE